jgi:LDH2 family malate/lactate/ureidoglycolate dehydrogenase
MSETKLIAHSSLVNWIQQVLVHAGVPDAVGSVEAKIMAEADLLGVPSHGVRMLPGLVRGIRDGRIRRDPDVRLLKEHVATCVLDGGLGPGRFIATQAMQQAIGRSQTCGIGACLAIRTSHWGRAHHYACQAAVQGVIGICTTNAMTNMVAWGATSPLLGNNPLAIGVPFEPPDEPLVLDIAMSQAAIGKIGTWLREGRKAEPGWGLDECGQPTDDPEAILASGRVLPFGGHKGAGLALMLELLTGAFAGGLLPYQLIERDSSGLDSGSSKFFIALDPEAFFGRTVLLEKTRELLDWIRNHAGSGAEVALPGERGWAARARYLAEGIPIHAEIAAQLDGLSIPLPWL